MSEQGEDVDPHAKRGASRKGVNMSWILLAALSSFARADSFDLANGSTIEGTLATYELGGNCQIFVASGPVRGATLLLPCTEIAGFRRAGADSRPATAALAAPMPTEELGTPGLVVTPGDGIEDAPEAGAMPVDVAPTGDAPPAPAEPAPDEAPVAARASLPEGYALPAASVPEEALAAAEEAPAGGPSADNLRGSPRPTPSLSAPEAAPAEEPAPPTQAPEGWRQKEATSSGLPRWLHKALYGDEDPQGEDAEGGEDT